MQERFLSRQVVESVPISPEISAKKLRQRRNEEAVGHLIIGVLGIICLYIIYLRIVAFYRSYGTQYKRFKRWTAFFRKKLLSKIPGFVSTGHAIVINLYVIITLSVMFSNIDWSMLNGFAKRLGWLTVFNISLAVFLGLKNTPLALLSIQSYEKLNCLHQVAGYFGITFFVLHASIYTRHLAKVGYLSVLVEEEQIKGILAGTSMIIIFLTATFLRKKRYEAFYVSHVLMVIFVLIMAGLHRPNITRTKSSFILIFAAAIWALDRLVIFAKYFVFGLNNTASITPLPHGGTRVIFSKKISSGVIPGQHFFIWLPAVRTFQTHPFTCISTDPLEFIISAQNGFTRSLYDLAVKEPGAKLKASITGPYGVIPDLTLFHKVIFIAGGSGATFTCSLANHLVSKLDQSSKTRIDFVLIQKHQESIEWTSSHLSTLVSSSIVAVHLYVTRGKSSESSQTRPILPGPTHSSGSSTDLEKNVKIDQPVDLPPLSTEEKNTDTCTISDPNTNMPIVVHPGRPEIELFISQSVSTASNSERVAVVACGPTAMMKSVRKAVVNNIRLEGPSLELFCEEFGW